MEYLLAGAKDVVAQARVALEAVEKAGASDGVLHASVRAYQRSLRLLWDVEAMADAARPVPVLMSNPSNERGV